MDTLHGSERVRPRLDGSQHDAHMVSRRRFLAATATVAAGSTLSGCAANAAANGQSRPPQNDRPKNVILMIPDGFGIASTTIARIALGRRLALDSFVVGHNATKSSDNYVTDSAAAGTALAAGLRTYNGAISVDDDQQPVASILEAAQTRGFKTGLVTTTRITHATPAVFAAHVPARSMEEEIAVQMLANRVDLMMGGGVSFFAPRPTGRRTDDQDLIAEARQAGYHVVSDRDQMQAAQSLPVLGLFSAEHMAYEVDRHHTNEPSLAEMTTKALELLSGPEGFFVMVEGGRIDHAAHGNDAAGHLFDVIAYDEAVQVALDFAQAYGDTLVVSVADHECGGCSIGRDNVYGFNPEVILATTASGDGMLAEALRRNPEPTLDDFRRVIKDTSPIDELDEFDVAFIEAGIASASQYEPANSLARVVSKHALVGWTTGGHTGEDVTVHAYGPGTDRFRGVTENYEIAQSIASLLDLDLEAETIALRRRMRDVHFAPVE